MAPKKASGSSKAGEEKSDVQEKCFCCCAIGYSTVFFTVSLLISAIVLYSILTFNVFDVLKIKMRNVYFTVCFFYHFSFFIMFTFLSSKFMA